MRTSPILFLGLVLTTGLVFAADTSPGLDGTTLPALFKQLDANGDGLLSQEEANAVPTLGEAYESFNTHATIQQPAKNAHEDGITLQQFEAGMQAAKRSGAFGPAVSGGEKYWVYPDGSRVSANGEPETDTQR